MKKIFLIYLVAITLNTLSQTELEKWKYFEKFVEPEKPISDKQKVIKDNWKQYFKEDILHKLSGYDYCPLMLDSYGSPYANELLFKNTDSSFFAAGIEHDANNLKYSMFQVFSYDNNKEILNKNLNSITNPEEKKIYDTLINKDFKTIDEFYELYDKLHFNKVYNAIKEKMIGKKKILFFIHGYNVPYSLACIQADAIMDLLKTDVGANTKEILLVPIFWTSNDAKRSDILSKTNFSTKNSEDPENGKKFWFYSNRAYYAAITLRKILNTIDSTKDVLVFGHSLGTTIATTAFINTTTKLDFRRLNRFLKTNECNQKELKNPEKFKAKADAVTFDLVTGMLNTKLPVASARIFLSAAAIPGQKTFKDINTCLMQNKKFYVSINKHDVMLTKNVARQKFKILKLIVYPSNFSSTTLGMNYHKDASKTQGKYPYKDKFIIDTVSTYEDHEIFTYMNQPAYKSLIARWYNNN